MGGWLLLSPARVMAGQAGQTVLFKYNDSFIKDASLESELLGDLGSGPDSWATVNFADLPANPGRFTMDIATFFRPGSGSPALTQLAYNLDPTYYKKPFPFVVQSCDYLGSMEPTPSTCDGFDLGMITADYGVDSVGVTGSAQTRGYDLLIDLPPGRHGMGSLSNPKGKGASGEAAATSAGQGWAMLDNSQSPIRLTIQGPGDFSVSLIDGYQSSTGYESVAKVQRLADGGSTVLIGIDPPVDPPIDPPADSVPGPLPLLGAAAGFGLSRRLRRRLALVPQRQASGRG